MMETLSAILNLKTSKGRKIRALDPIGKGRALITVMADQRFAVNGFANKNLREALASYHQFEGKSKKQLSGAITQLIRMMRDHGLIHKLSCQYQYRLTPQGQKITALVQAALAAFTKRLLDYAA